MMFRVSKSATDCDPEPCCVRAGWSPGPGSGCLDAPGRAVEETRTKCSAITMFRRIAREGRATSDGPPVPPVMTTAISSSALDHRDLTAVRTGLARGDAVRPSSRKSIARAVAMTPLLVSLCRFLTRANGRGGSLSTMLRSRRVDCALPVLDCRMAVQSIALPAAYFGAAIARRGFRRGPRAQSLEPYRFIAGYRS